MFGFSEIAFWIVVYQGTLFLDVVVGEFLDSWICGFVFFWFIGTLVFWILGFWDLSMGPARNPKDVMILCASTPITLSTAPARIPGPSKKP